MTTTALLLLSSLITERRFGPSSDSSLSCCKRAWYQSSLNISFPAWQFLFFNFPYVTQDWSHLCFRVNRSSRSAPDSKSSVHLVTTAGGNNWQVIFGHTVHLTHDWNPQLVPKMAKSNVLRHIRVSSLWVTTFKVNPLCLLCWWTTAKCSRVSSAVMH